MRLTLLALALGIACATVGCTKKVVENNAQPVAAPVAPLPQPHPHPHPHPKGPCPPDCPCPAPCPPKCPCPPKKDLPEAKTAVGTVKELRTLATGGLVLIIEGEKAPRTVARDANIVLNGTTVTPQDVALWFKQTRDPVRVKLVTTAAGVATVAEFWAEKH